MLIDKGKTVELKERTVVVQKQSISQYSNSTLISTLSLKSKAFSHSNYSVFSSLKNILYVTDLLSNTYSAYDLNFDILDLSPEFILTTKLRVLKFSYNAPSNHFAIAELHEPDFGQYSDQAYVGFSRFDKTFVFVFSRVVHILTTIDNSLELSKSPNDNILDSKNFRPRNLNISEGDDLTCFTSSSSHVAVGALSGKVVVIQNYTKSPVITILHWHHTYVTSLLLSGSTLFSSSLENVLVEWCLEQRTKKFIPRLKHGDYIIDIQISESRDKLVLFFNNKHMKKIDTSYKVLSDVKVPYFSRLNGSRYIVSRENYIIGKSVYGNIQFYNPTTHESFDFDVCSLNRTLTATNDKQSRCVDFVRFSGDGKCMCTFDTNVYSESSLPSHFLKFWAWNEAAKSFDLTGTVSTPKLEDIHLISTPDEYCCVTSTLTSLSAYKTKSDSWSWYKSEEKVYEHTSITAANNLVYVCTLTTIDVLNSSFRMLATYANIPVFSETRSHTIMVHGQYIVSHIHKKILIINVLNDSYTSVSFPYSVYAVILRNSYIHVFYGHDKGTVIVCLNYSGEYVKKGGFGGKARALFLDSNGCGGIVDSKIQRIKLYGENFEMKKESNRSTKIQENVGFLTGVYGELKNIEVNDVLVKDESKEKITGVFLKSASHLLLPSNKLALKYFSTILHKWDDKVDVQPSLLDKDGTTGDNMEIIAETKSVSLHDCDFDFLAKSFMEIGITGTIGKIVKEDKNVVTKDVSGVIVIE